MTLTLDLDEEQEARLSTQAKALGLDPADFLKKIAGLDKMPEPPAEMFAGKTLADLILEDLGVVDSADYFGGQPSDLSTRTGKAFAEMLHEDHK